MSDKASVIPNKVQSNIDIPDAGPSQCFASAGDKRAILRAAERGTVEEFKRLIGGCAQPFDYDVVRGLLLQQGLPYGFNAVLCACYGNNYKVLHMLNDHMIKRGLGKRRDELLIQAKQVHGDKFQAPGSLDEALREVDVAMQEERQRELVRLHNSRSWSGRNSAMVAAAMGGLETILYLVRLDMDGKFGDEDLFEQRDIWGKTALDWAAAMGHFDVSEVLVIRALYKMLSPPPPPRSHNGGKQTAVDRSRAGERGPSKEPAAQDPKVTATRQKLRELLRDKSLNREDYNPVSVGLRFGEMLQELSSAAAVAAAASGVQQQPQPGRPAPLPGKFVSARAIRTLTSALGGSFTSAGIAPGTFAGLQQRGTSSAPTGGPETAAQGPSLGATVGIVASAARGAVIAVVTSATDSSAASGHIPDAAAAADSALAQQTSTPAATATATSASSGAEGCAAATVSAGVPLSGTATLPALTPADGPAATGPVPSGPSDVAGSLPIPDAPVPDAAVPDAPVPVSSSSTATAGSSVHSTSAIVVPAPDNTGASAALPPVGGDAATVAATIAEDVPPMPAAAIAIALHTAVPSTAAGTAGNGGGAMQHTEVADVHRATVHPPSRLCRLSVGPKSGPALLTVDEESPAAVALATGDAATTRDAATTDSRPEEAPLAGGRRDENQHEPPVGPRVRVLISAPPLLFSKASLAPVAPTNAGHQESAAGNVGPSTSHPHRTAPFSRFPFGSLPPLHLAHPHVSSSVRGSKPVGSSRLDRPAGSVAAARVRQLQQLQRGGQAAADDQEGDDQEDTAGGDGNGDGDSDWAISEELLLEVVEAAHLCSKNCMQVIIDIQALLTRANYSDELVDRCSAWKAMLLDRCQNKLQMRTLLTPVSRGEKSPVSYAFEASDKDFLSNKYIQQLFTDLWDGTGLTERATTVVGFPCAVGLLVLSFAVWAAGCPVAIVVRSFFSPAEEFFRSRRGGGRGLRYPWQMPLFRWLMAQCTLLVFVVLLTQRIMAQDDDATLSSATTPLDVLLAVWCFAMLVDEVQECLEEGWEAYWTSAWNFIDITMAICYLLQFFLRIGSLRAATGPHTMEVLLVANDFLCVSALMSWFRLVSVLDLSSAVGPLIQTIRQMILTDLTRFGILVTVMLLGFTVGMEALFKTVCLDSDCTQYSQWPYQWQGRGIMGGLTYLQYAALGNAEVTDFEQKRVTGIIFYLVFVVMMCIMLLNLFIAMLSETYSRISEKAHVEFLYRKARIIECFSRREAVCPPYNLLLLLFGFLGNTLRQNLLGMKPRLDEEDAAAAAAALVLLQQQQQQGRQQEPAGAGDGGWSDGLDLPASLALTKSPHVSAKEVPRTLGWRLWQRLPLWQRAGGKEQEACPGWVPELLRRLWWGITKPREFTPVRLRKYVDEMPFSWHGTQGASRDPQNKYGRYARQQLVVQRFLTAAKRQVAKRGGGTGTGTGTAAPGSQEGDSEGATKAALTRSLSCASR